MAQQTIDFHISLSQEAIRLGPLEVRFLITGEDNNRSQDTEVLCVITPAGAGPQLLHENAGVIDADVGGELARF